MATRDKTTDNLQMAQETTSHGPNLLAQMSVTDALILVTVNDAHIELMTVNEALILVIATESSRSFFLTSLGVAGLAIPFTCRVPFARYPSYSATICWILLSTLQVPALLRANNAKSGNDDECLGAQS